MLGGNTHDSRQVFVPALQHLERGQTHVVRPVERRAGLDEERDAVGLAEERGNVERSFSGMPEDGGERCGKAVGTADCVGISPVLQ